MYKEVWKEILISAKKFKEYFIPGILVYVIASSTFLIIPLFVKLLVDGALEGIFNEKLLIIATAFIIGQNILYRIFDYCLIQGQTKTFSDLYNRAYDSIIQHSYSFFSNTFAGSLIAKVKRFAHSSITIQDQVLFNIIKPVVFILTAITILSFEQSLFALILFVWTVIYCSISISLSTWQRKYDEDEAKQETKTTAILSDIISNVLTVKMFSSQKQEEKAMHHEANMLGHKMKIAWFKGMRVWATQSFLMALFEATALWIIILGLTHQTMTPGTAILIQSYVLLILANMWNIGRSVQRISKGLSDMKEMVEIMHTPISIVDEDIPEKSKIQKGKIDFYNINFSYDEKNTVLKNFHLEIKSGEKVGLVGLSGSGKTTITKLLLRFMDVQEGNITIDEQDIRLIKQEDLRRQITYVPQEPLLFHRTIKENISYANPKATTKEIEQAAKQAYAHDFIKDLPQGYNTLVGERGIKLSGGERQRVAIARAILKKSPIIVMDEATSSLDTISEKYIQQATEKLMKNKTAIVIAHRLSTVQRMDRIIVLSKGKIVEEGTHTQLLKKKGHYYKLYKHQQL